ncbi:MAG: multidrug effflux MFS transporter [Gammaproteobacteria bacterium]|jgi:DHA1 family bicyclomycin/chloramphenicol resistance-like MFS transporter
MNTRIFSQAFMSMAVIALIITTASIETDIFIPSLPTMKDYFSASEQKIQLLVTMNFVGLCIASFIYGPLADAYGRRPILLIGMFLFTISSVACAFTNNLELLLFWRLIQGLGCSVAFIVPETIIYDNYNKEKAATLLGIYGSIITFVMAFAPIIGNYLYLKFSWQANFILIAGLSVVTFLAAIVFVRESLHKEKRMFMHTPTIVKNYKRLLTSPKAMAYLYLSVAISAAYFVYVANLSLIFIDHLKVDKAMYGYYQGFILLVFAAISFSIGKIISILGIDRTRKLGTEINIVGSILMLCVAIWTPNNPLFITLAMTIFTAGFALNAEIFFGDYMDVHPDIRGIAAAMGASAELVILLVFVAISGIFFNGTIMPVAIMIFLSGISSAAILYWLHWQK